MRLGTGSKGAQAKSLCYPGARRITMLADWLMWLLWRLFSALFALVLWLLF